jgi:periplasmic protein TonB
MFARLPESRAVREMRPGGTVVSVLGHGLLVAALVVLTADARGVTAADPPPRIEDWINVAPPPVPVAVQGPPASGRPRSVAAPDVPALVAPLTVPITLPPIDPTARAITSADDIGTYRRARDPGGMTMGVRGGAGSTLGVVAFAASEVDKPVVVSPGAQPPAYPDALRQAGVTGEVIAQFVVDSTGRAIMRTFTVVESAHGQFSDAVRLGVARMRFLPAELNGRRVPQLVRLPFRFDLVR